MLSPVSLILIIFVGFWVVEYFEMINWTAIAAIAAAVGAIFAGWQLCSDRHWRKLDRTFSHSPYRNEKFLSSIEKLKNKYEPFRDRNSDDVIEVTIQKEFVPHLVLVANLWGQMAMEYRKGQLDKDIAERLLKWNFCKFCRVFNHWLKRDGREKIYADTLELYDEWKT